MESRGGARNSALIDRAPERAWLHAWAQEAREGTPQLALITGEAGIGKSRLARDLIAGLDDARLAVTRCREAPAGAFAPFRESLFPTLDAFAEHSRLAEELDVGRGEDTRDQDPEERTHRFLSRVATLTVELARSQFLAILIDDIHWADPRSLELIEFVAAHATDAALSGPVPLLIVCTTRPPTDETFTAALERLEREPTASTLHLEGLGSFEIAELARRHGHGDLRQRDITALAESTAGNPLFVEAILRSPRPTEQVRLPVHIRDAVAKPMAALAPADHDLLCAASCIDAEIDAGVLAAILDRPGREVREDLDRLARGGLLEADHSHWEFSHTLYRRVAYEELAVDQREELHRRIAGHAEARPDADARVIAHHLLQAGPQIPDERLLPIAARAGDLEFAGGHWTRAATLYGVVMDRATDDSLGGLDAQAEILHRLGKSLIFTGEYEEGLAAYDRAAEIHAAAGDHEAHLGILVARARAHVGRGEPGTDVDDAALADVLRRIETDSPAVAATALAQLSQTRWMAGDLAAAVDYAQQALDRIETPTGDEADAGIMAQLSLAMVGWTRFDLPGAQAHLDRAQEWAEAAIEPGMRLGPANRLSINMVWTGDLGGAVRTASNALEGSDASRYNVEVGLPLTALGMVDLVRGDPARAVGRFERAVRVDQFTGYRWSTIFALPPLCVAWDLLTRPDAAAEALEQLTDLMGPTSSWTRAVRLLHTAERIRRVGLDAAPDSLPDPPLGSGNHPVSIGTAGLAAAAVELAAVVDRPALAAGAESLLVEAGARGLVYIGGVGILLDRVLGKAQVQRAAADGPGPLDRGIANLERALQRATADGAALEMARSARDLADALRIRGVETDRERAAVLSNQHHDLLESLGLVHLKPVITTAGTDETRDGTHTQVVMFADVSSSTRLAQEMGDLVYTEHLRTSLAAINEVVEACEGRVINHTGDGLLLTFDSAARAIDCALRSHEVLGSYILDYHFGIHAGDVVEVDGNIFGATVNTAARLCDQAGACETVVSELVTQLAAGARGFEFEDRGTPTLRGVLRPIPVFAVTRPES